MRLRLIHWNVKEAAPLLETLRAAGHDVALTSAANTGLLRTLRGSPPHAVIIDLTRQPSHGQEVAIAIRGAKTIKHLPILFLEGEPERVEAIRRMLPDALYTSRAKLATALKRAKPVANPARPQQMMERFGSRTAAKARNWKRYAGGRGRSAGGLRPSRGRSPRWGGIRRKSLRDTAAYVMVCP
jgi:CheY-like chemotaxis protein